MSIGIYGKLPSHGDFVHRSVPDDFVNPWDAWLQSGIARSQRDLGAAWTEVFLTSPLWRFALPGGVLGGSAWAGVLLPSTDRVSRCFPLTVVAELDPAAEPFQLSVAGNAWFDWVEAFARRLLEEEMLDATRLDARLHESEILLEAGRFSGGAPLSLDEMAEHSSMQRFALTSDMDMGRFFSRLAAHAFGARLPNTSLWWSAGSDRVTPTVLMVHGLPDPAAFGDLLVGPMRIAHEQDSDAPDATSAEADPHAETLTTGFPAVGPMLKTPYCSAAATDRGHWREENQDAHIERPECGFWLVADGLGGHRSGAFASRLVIERAAATNFSGPPPTRVQSIGASILAAHAELRARAAREPGFNAASTVVAVSLHDGNGVVLWAGDSRLYRLRNRVLEQLTRDHSDTSAQSVQEQSSGSAVTRAVGGTDTLDLDQRGFDVVAGDRFLLCTDGLYADLTSEEIAEALVGGGCGAAVTALVALALRRGGQDNATAVVIDVSAQEVST